MIDRINLILKAKNVTARQFAEEIGIQPSGMSHILSGRNRPSLDFVLKVINRYPEIDINWLMFGKGEMMVTSTPPTVSSYQQPVRNESEITTVKTPARQNTQPELDLFSGTLFDTDDNQESMHQLSTQQPTHQQPAQQTISPATVPYSAETDYLLPTAQESSDLESPKEQLNENDVFQNVKKNDLEKQNVVKKKIAKVVILYTDHSFSEYYPEN